MFIYYLPHLVRPDAHLSWAKPLSPDALCAYSSTLKMLYLAEPASSTSRRKTPLSKDKREEEICWTEGDSVARIALSSAWETPKDSTAAGDTVLFPSNILTKTTACWETVKNNVHAPKSLCNNPYHDFLRISLQSFKNTHYKNQSWSETSHYHPWCRLLHATVQHDTHYIHVVGLSSTCCCWVEKQPMPTSYHTSGNTFIWFFSTLCKLIKWFK